MPARSSRLLMDRLPACLWVVLAALLLFTPGCGGCWNGGGAAGPKQLTDEELLAEQERKKKKKAEKPKPDFELPDPVVLPNDPFAILPTFDPKKDADEAATSPSTDEEDLSRAIARIKPGHWVAAVQRAKANNFDFQGLLASMPVDANGDPLEIEHTRFRLLLDRPASLPKGQTKYFESLFFLTRRPADVATTYQLRNRLSGYRTTNTAVETTVGGIPMRPHEYYLVVLSADPSRYVDLPKLDSIAPQKSEFFDPSEDSGNLMAARYYYVVLDKADKNVALPSHPLAWSMIAHVVWDDINPQTLTKQQQQALLDWLHWGGQLIVSGPNSLDKLKGSFLEPFLPCASEEAATLSDAELQPINQYWSPEDDERQRRFSQTDKQSIRIAKTWRWNLIAGKSIPGVKLALAKEGRFVPQTGELVAERRIGAGRIVATGFPLTDASFRFWANRDNFFNACLLRRPGRKYVGNKATGEFAIQWTAPYERVRPNDPRLTTGLRYFTRDVGHFELAASRSPAAPAVRPPLNTPPVVRGFPPGVFDDTNFLAEQWQNYVVDPAVDDSRFAGYQADPFSGIGGWSDSGGVSRESRDALRKAAGISIPPADFVLKALGVYLLVLVPLNWLVFWLLGRVEWAWIAAPVIAMIGAGAVIQQAQLDIGFARSQTEICVLEVQGSYARAHLTRYVALYTSLSSAYTLAFEDADAVALPFAADLTYQRRPTDSFYQSQLHRDEQMALRNVQVQSNSTEMVHGEQMLDLQGALTLSGDSQKGWRFENDSFLTLQGAAIIRRNGDQYEAAYLGELVPGAQSSARFSGSAASPTWPKEWDESPVLAPQGSQSARGEVRLHGLARLAATQLKLQEGDARLIAWSSEQLPGLQVLPSAAQKKSYTLIVAHLDRGVLPPPSRDDNHRSDVVNDEITKEPEADSGL